MFHLRSKAGVCHFTGNFFLARSVLFFPYTSQKIADCPRNTHSCCNSKSKKKSIPSIFQRPNSISFHYAVHTIIKSTSGNPKDYRSNKKRCRYFFTDSCKNFCIHICNKASHQSRKKNISQESTIAILVNNQKTFDTDIISSSELYIFYILQVSCLYIF